MIDITGLRPSRVLQALYNNTPALGMGVLHDLGRDMSEPEAMEEIIARSASMDRWVFDWVRGRPIKIAIVDRSSGSARAATDMVIGDERLYDRDAPSGTGTCARVIAALRADPSSSVDRLMGGPRSGAGGSDAQG